MFHNVRYGSSATTSRRSYELIRLLTESITFSRAIGDDIDTAWSINKLGLIALLQGNFGEAEQLLEQSLALFQSLQYTRGIAWVLGSLGSVRLRQGDYTRAAELFDDSLRRYSNIIQGSLI